LIVFSRRKRDRFSSDGYQGSPDTSGANIDRKQEVFLHRVRELSVAEKSVVSQLRNCPHRRFRPRSLAGGRGKRFTVSHSAPSAKSVNWGRNAKTEDERDRGGKIHPIFFYDN
jgi:hypothetical protein